VRFAEGLVEGDRDACPFLPFGEDLERELRGAALEFHVAELVDAEHVDAAVAVDGLSQLPVAGGLDEPDRFPPRAASGPR